MAIARCRMESLATLWLLSAVRFSSTFSILLLAMCQSSSYIVFIRKCRSHSHKSPSMAVVVVATFSWLLKHIITSLWRAAMLFSKAIRCSWWTQWATHTMGEGSSLLLSAQLSSEQWITLIKLLAHLCPRRDVLWWMALFFCWFVIREGNLYRRWGRKITLFRLCVLILKANHWTFVF